MVFLKHEYQHLNASTYKSITVSHLKPMLCRYNILKI